MDWAKAAARRNDNHLSFRIWCVLYWRFYGIYMQCIWRQPMSLCQLQEDYMVTRHHEIWFIYSYRWDCDAYMLVAYKAKPLSKPLLTDVLSIIPLRSPVKLNHGTELLYKKYVSKCRLQNVGHFLQDPVHQYLHAYHCRLRTILGKQLHF